MWNDENEGLIPSGDDSTRNEEAFNALNQNNIKHVSRSPPKFLLPAAACVASFGGVLFGYDIGIISGALLLLKEEFQLSCRQQEMIVTTLIIGGLVASIFGGQLLDRFGRKLTIIINAGIFILGAVILTLSRSYYVFICGRFVVGFAVSLSAVGDCVYISEIAPPRKRGLLVSLNELGITLGLLLAYLVNFLLINTDDGWRYMFGISALPAVLQALGMIFLPASPRWLITKGKEEKAKKIMDRLWPHLDNVKEIEKLKGSLCSENSYNFFDLFGERENMRLRMFIGVGIILFQQLTGQPTVLYYAPALFKTLGFDKNASATLATLGLGVVKVIFTFITLCTVDKIGRRTFLLLGALIMTGSLVTLSALTFEKFDSNRPKCDDIVGTQILHKHLLDQSNYCHNQSFIHNQTGLANNSFSQYSVKNTPYKFINTTNSTPPHLQTPVWNSTLRHNCPDSDVKDDEENNDIPQSIRYTCLVALMFFVIGYAIGYGPMSWLILTEIFPTGIKGRAVSAATIVNWGANILISMTFLDVIESIGPFFTFLSYALIGVISIFFLYHVVPETKEKSLEIINAELNQRTIGCKLNRCCGDAHVILVEDEQDILLENREGTIVEEEDVEDEV